jgi:hypothetical protein
VRKLIRQHSSLMNYRSSQNMAGITRMVHRKKKLKLKLKKGELKHDKKERKRMREKERITSILIKLITEKKR